MHRLAVAQDERPGQPVFVDVFLDERVEPGEAFSGEAGVFRRNERDTLARDGGGPGEAEDQDEAEADGQGGALSRWMR